MINEFINQYQPIINNSDINAINSYLKSGGFITEYKNTRLFENKLANFFSVKDAIIYPNGTLTLISILKQLGIGRGDKVIGPNFTMAATAFAVNEVGADIVFCDIEWPSLCISIDSIIEIINEKHNKISAIMFVAVNGRYPNYDINKLLTLCHEFSINLIEDSAQAMGSYYPSGEHIGSIGVAGSFSFSMPKLITTGQGGAIISNNQNLISKLRTYRDFGRCEGGGSDIHESIGLNFKFTDLQAVLGLSQLNRVDKIISLKKTNYNFLKENILNKSVSLIHNDIEYTTPWFYEVVTEKPTNLTNFLRKYNIGSRLMYPELNKQRAFKFHEQHHYDFPVSKKISSHGVWIPSHPKLSMSDLIRMVEALNSYDPNIIY
jgi:perosamine synthetase